MDLRLRSWMFVPGHSHKMVAKVPTLGAEAIIFDLQDAVPPDEKDRALGLVSQTLEGDPGTARIFVRINDLDTGGGERDLANVVKPGLDGVMLPLTVEPEQLWALDDALGRVEQAMGLKLGSIVVVPQLESPRGILNALELAEGPRVVAVAFGGEDYALSLGTERTPAGTELFFARAMMANAASAAGVQAVDTVYRDFRDDEGLAEECAVVRTLGMTGKLAIHPAQLDIIHRVFAPSAAEIECAREIVAAFDQAGGGVVTVNGMMVDAPVVERARRVLETAEQKE